MFAYRLVRNIVVSLFLLATTAPSAFCAELQATLQPTALRSIKVVTSISPLADIVKNIGGDFVTVTFFVPLDVDPHSYEPTFSSLKSISAAEIIFLNGDGLDRAARENLMAVKGRRSRVVDLSQYIPAAEKNGIDPHYWLDLRLVEYYVQAITANLSALAPEEVSYFQANAKRYTEQIRVLDQRYRKACSRLPADCREVILYHNAWTYTINRYGLSLVGIIESAGTHEESARQLVILIKKARLIGVRAIISEPSHGARMLATVKEEANIPVVLTLAEDSLREPPCDTYLGMMDADLNQLSIKICHK